MSLVGDLSRVSYACGCPVAVVVPRYILGAGRARCANPAFGRQIGGPLPLVDGGAGCSALAGS